MKLTSPLGKAEGRGQRAEGFYDNRPIAQPLSQEDSEISG